MYNILWNVISSSQNTSFSGIYYNGKITICSISMLDFSMERAMPLRGNNGRKKRNNDPWFKQMQWEKNELSIDKNENFKCPRKEYKTQMKIISVKKLRSHVIYVIKVVNDVINLCYTSVRSWVMSYFQMFHKFNIR